MRTISLAVLFAALAIMAGQSGTIVHAQDYATADSPVQEKLQAAEPAKAQEPQPAKPEAQGSPVAEDPEGLDVPRPKVAALNAGEDIDLSAYAPGTIIVMTSARKLHFILQNGEHLTYPVGVGKKGKSWSGQGVITGKRQWPPWSPPRALKREKPWVPDYVAGGSPENPMGAAAMTLSVDQYAIHGTNSPSSIGTFASFGCIRMHNRDVMDLYRRVHVGTRVVVLK